VGHVDLHLGGGASVDRDIERDKSTPGIRGLPDRSGPIANIVGGIGDEGESLVARQRGVGVDGRQIKLVLASGEVGDLVQLIDAVDENIL
jgi:hypothetical protein